MDSSTLEMEWTGVQRGPLQVPRMLQTKKNVSVSKKEGERSERLVAAVLLANNTCPVG